MAAIHQRRPNDRGGAILSGEAMNTTWRLAERRALSSSGVFCQETMDDTFEAMEYTVGNGIRSRSGSRSPLHVKY